MQHDDMQLRGLTHLASLRTQTGFTTVEILVATAISLVALATVTSFNRFQLFALRNQANQLDLQTTARNFVDLFAREVRRAGVDPTCAKTFSGIVDAGATWLRIQSDLNGTGIIGAPNEDVRYFYDFSTNSARRTANGTTEILVSGVNLDGSRIRYFDTAGTEIVPSGTSPLTAAQRAAIRRVRIELAMAGAEVDPLNSLPLISRLVADVDLRNRFFVTGTACP